MLLAIDIGNSDIKLAVFQGERIRSSKRLATNKKAGFKQYRPLLARLLAGEIKNSRIEGIIICSVVPKLTPIFKKALFYLFKIRPLILGKDIIAPVKNLYRKPEQVGQDRLANAAAALNNYGGPLIVVDFGTALTFDVVSANGSYLGGIIVPGLQNSLQTLIKNAEMLPEIYLTRPKAFLGRDTIASMKSGAVFGYSFLVEGILKQLKKGLKVRPRVIATGGAVDLMAGYCPSINKIDHNLTLEGLRLIYEKKQKKT